MGLLFSWLLVIYLGIVLPLDHLFPVINDTLVAIVLIILAAVATEFMLRVFALRSGAAEARFKNITLLSASLLLSLLAIDVGYTAFANLNPEVRRDRNVLLAGRLDDRHLWDGEVMPHIYRPTEQNFWVYKPGQTSAGATYGEFYYPALLRHELLRESVLQLRDIVIQIDQYGFRNRRGPAGVEVFALGDSFCMGHHMADDLIWANRLAASSGKRIYNMGVSGTGPMQQVLLLEYFLRTYPEEFRPRRLLWMIFEGNDLENSYALKHRGAADRESWYSGMFKGTIVDGLLKTPSLLRDESVLRLFIDGQIRFDLVAGSYSAPDHYKLDGETISFPWYHSPRFGYQLFHQEYIDQATQPESYVLNHPNLPALRNAFGRMEALARELKFEVTVVTLPSNVRLYHDVLDDFPVVSESPHFLRQVQKFAQDSGFLTIELEDQLAPFAREELIFMRDDSHWNERGHQLVAELLAEHLFGQ
jgi:hypothetical protein